MKRLTRLFSSHLTAIVVLAVLALALLVALPLKMGTDALEAEARSHVNEVADTNAMAIDTQMAAVTGLVDGVADDARTLGDPQSALENEDLDRLRVAGVDIKTAAFVNTDGIVERVSPNGPAAGTLRVSDRDYFTRAIADDRPHISGVFRSRQQPPTDVVAVSHSIRDATGNLRGVIVASIDVNAGFQRWVDSASERQQASVVIYDAAGQVVVGNDPFVGTRTPGQVREKYLSSFAAVGATGWTVGAYVDRATAFAATDSLRNRTMFVASVLAGVMIAGAFALAREMRARGRIEEHLSMAEANINDVMDASEQMMFELDANGRILACNATVGRLTGFDCQELVGKLLYDTVVPEAYRDRAKGVFASLAATEDPATWRHKAEGRMLCKLNDDELTVEVNLWTADVGGRLKVYTIINDITKRKRLERDREAVLLQQRRLVDELRQADKNKSDFVSTVSHELRTPLTSIVGYLEMLNEGYGGELNDQQNSMLSVVNRNSRRLLGLIEDLLTLSRIESRKLRIEHFDLDVGHLVRNGVQAMIPSATDKSLELSVDVDPKVGVVQGDQNQLERVLLNLLSNAIKFTPEGGTISVRALPAENGVRLEVADNGIGISAEEQTRLFSRFFRSSEVQERAIQGTGLGLAIVKSIINLHGGTVDVHSEHGVGTTVRVWLPASDVVVHS